MQSGNAANVHHEQRAIVRTILVALRVFLLKLAVGGCVDIEQMTRCSLGSLWALCRWSTALSEQVDG